MKKIGIIIYCATLTLLCTAQVNPDFNNFTPLYSSGELPVEATMSGSEFVETARDAVMNEGGKKNKKAKKEFLVTSSYNIKDLFVSGRVLYNDPISTYVNKVHKYVTASDAKLQAETKVFVIKSSVVNAFATNQGYVFITTGLLAKLKNEAQLGFVLCHELIHYKNKHVIKSYVEAVKIEREDGAYQKNNIDAKYLAKTNYSRENESEADRQGFELYSKTDYSTDAVSQVFTILKFANTPIENYVFDTKGMFETEHLVFPQEYAITEVSELSGEEEDEEDIRSTHPNLKRRRADISTQIAALAIDNAKRVNYILPEDEFIKVQKLSQFDLCHTNLLDRDYDLAIYNAACLLKNNPGNIYLKKIVLKGIYGLYKYAHAERFRQVCNSYNDVSGEQQRLNFLLDKMQAEELSVVALNYAWRLKKELKNNDGEVNVIVDDLFYDMVRHHYRDKEFFSLKTQSEQPTTVEPTDKKESKPRTRTDKIRKEKAEVTGYLNYAFVDLLKDSAFANTYDALIRKAFPKKSYGEDELAKGKKKRKNKELKYDKDTKDWLEQNVNSGRYNEDKDTYALGLDKLIVVNPFYLQIDERKSSPILYSGTEEKQKLFNENIADLSGDIKLDVEIIDKNKLSQTSIDYYNDMSVLLDWINERADHKSLEILPTDYLRIEEISKKYGTEHIGFMGTINFIEKKNQYKNIVYGALCIIPYMWFITIPYFIKRLDHTYVYTTVFNLRTGQPEMIKYGQSPSNDREYVVKSFLYDYLNQVKQKPKKR